MDSHLRNIFRLLGWVPNEESGSKCTMLARAIVEGWFPKQKWGELNQQYAGIGQLFRNKNTASKFLQHAWEKLKNPNYPFTNGEEIAINCYNLKIDIV